jgi:hypothetical protein
VTDDRPRYRPEDFAGYAAPSPPAPARLRVVEATAETNAGTLRLDDHARPPLERLEALTENSRRFAATWRRARGNDLKDQTTSGYEASLMRQMTDAGWSDQEQVDACIYWRRKHGEELKTRVDYYVRTLAFARSGMSEAELIGALPATESAGGGREEKLAALRRDLLVPVARVLRRGGRTEKVWYFLILDDGTELDLGQSTDLLDLRRSRAVLLDGGKNVLPTWKPERWFGLVRLMQEVAEEEVITESSFAADLLDQIQAYVAERTADDEALYAKAVVANQPFVRGGQVYLHRSEFRRWLGFDESVKVDRPRLNVWLKRLGFAPVKVSVRHPQNREKVVNRSYWTADFEALGLRARETSEASEASATSKTPL